MEPERLTPGLFYTGSRADLAPYVTVDEHGVETLTVTATRQLLDALIPDDPDWLTFDEWERGAMLTQKMRERFRGDSHAR